ncbi:hypothetical protein IV203_036189 [Nitzschia inconspicua]|uniref:Uncharacterized protein n=1 Tax=Nitzschia inconspicua TaxID=303405 RepID=A0A9K3LFZ7_9STRA|nr:hypothetical protein IV203_036189 [Nitzschia inconspicua]
MVEVMNSNIRRRRKRALPKEKEQQPQQRSAPSKVDTTLLEDEAKLSFLDPDGDLLADRKPKFDSLPLLLETRRSGIGINDMRKWQTKTLLNFTKKPQQSIGRRQWRPYAHRTVPFTRLGTPPGDAVLAMDRTGSYVLSLGTKDNDYASPGLALRFYGIPSPASMMQQQQRRRLQRKDNPPVSMAPLLQCVPLLHGVGNIGPQQQELPMDVAEGAIFQFQGTVSPVSTPVRVLVSRDWKLGVAMICRKVFNDTIGESQTETTGTLVLFTMPRVLGASVKVYTCQNVQMSSVSQGIVRNLLWQVWVIPLSRNSNDQACCYASVPGYVVFHDEEDGYRITWCTEDSFLHDEGRLFDLVDGSSPLKNRVVPTQPILTRQQTWEEATCDRKSGNYLPLSEASVSSVDHLSVGHEAYLHVELLLADVLSKRKGFSETISDFFFSLISLHNGGRVANLVIAFARTRKACSIGVFVDIDLFTGCYEELDWVKEASTDTTTLKLWCQKLAINRRMKHVRAGPYAVSEKSTVDWSCIVQDTNSIDYDEEDDFDEGVWRDFVERKGPRTFSQLAVPKMITLSSLYPDCDIVSNEALLRCEPVKCMRTRDAPIQLLYG